MAEEQGVIAFSQNQDGLKIAMTNPDDLKIIHLIEKRSGQNLLISYITKSDLQEALLAYRPSLKSQFKKIIENFRDQSLSKEERDELTVRIVNILLEYGYQSKASDIHIEPYTDKIIARFRIDGVLHQILEIPKELHELILMRIKILSKMRTDEHRAAQDGKLRFEIGDEIIDVRISIVPITEGENIVMRLLSAKSRQYALHNLGFSEKNLEKIKKAAKDPHGMILVTGPTGCGKTTTLYGLIKILNSPKIHIATIEDPVEYDIEGISQIQVNTKTNLSFAKGLRAIVRQDPDIIMIGEIRDKETASIAINSALTGHLVLSTLHTNDAATTLPRLLDMEIEPFLIASTVNIVIAQRLIRKICEKCRFSYELSEKEIKMIEADSELKKILKKRGSEDIKKLRLYKGAGCKVCSGTGFRGRTGIFEILSMSEKIKGLVISQAISNKIAEIAKKEGMQTIIEHGIEKVFSGITTLEEIIRVTKT